MKTSPFVIVGSMLLFLSGCQRAVAPPQTIGHNSASGPAQKVPTASPSAEAAEPQNQQSGGDQTDDPGMTMAHDKTPLQEQPSGDESSRAAPNDGDAEPPQ